MTTQTTTRRIETGDFIEIPAWQDGGQVIAVEAAWYGSSEAQRVLVQSAPEQAGHWYTLEPDEFTLEDQQ